MATTTASPAVTDQATSSPATGSGGAPNSSPPAPTAAPASATEPSPTPKEPRHGAPPAPMTLEPSADSGQVTGSPSSTAAAPPASSSEPGASATTTTVQQQPPPEFSPATGSAQTTAPGPSSGAPPAGGQPPANYQEFFNSLPPRQQPNGTGHPGVGPTAQATFALQPGERIVEPGRPYTNGEPYLDGRVRDPIPGKLKGMTNPKRGNFGVLLMKTPSGQSREAKTREEEAKRTSESTALAAKLAFQDGYVSFNRKSMRQPDQAHGGVTISKLRRAIAGKPIYTARAQPLTPEETKAEQARLLTVLRTISPNAVVDQLCKALGYFGGVPGFPPPENGEFPQSERANGSGSLFIGWLGEIFPKLDQNGIPIPEKRPRGRPKGSKATKIRKDKGVKKGPRLKKNGAVDGVAGQEGDVDDSWVDVDDDAADGAPGPSRAPRAPAISTPKASRRAPAATPGSTGKKRGRPKGSKNKPKDPNATPASIVPAPAAGTVAATAAPPAVVTPIPPPVIPGLSAPAPATPATGTPKKRGRGPAKTPAPARPVQQGGSAFDYAVSALQAQAAAAAAQPGSSQTTSFTPTNAGQAASPPAADLTLTGKKRKRRSDAGKKRTPAAGAAAAASQGAPALNGIQEATAAAPSGEASAPPAKKQRKGRTSLPTGKAAKGKQKAGAPPPQPETVANVPAAHAEVIDLMDANDHDEDAALLAPLAADNMAVDEPDHEAEEPEEIEDDEEEVEEQQEDDFETDTYAALASQLEHDTAAAQQLHTMAAAMNTNQHHQHHQDSQVQRQLSQQSFSDGLSPNLATATPQNAANQMSVLTAGTRQQSKQRQQVQPHQIAQTVSPVPQQDSGYAQPSTSMSSGSVMSQQQQQPVRTSQFNWNQNQSDANQYRQTPQTQQQQQQFTPQQQQQQQKQQYSSYQTQPQYQTSSQQQQSSYATRHQQQQATATSSPGILSSSVAHQSSQFATPQTTTAANPYGTRSQSSGLQQQYNNTAYAASRRTTTSASPATYAATTHQHTASPAFGAPARPPSTSSNNSAASHVQGAGMQGFHHQSFDTSQTPSLFGNVDVDAATASAAGHHGLGMGTSGYGTRSSGAAGWGVGGYYGERR